MLDKLDKDFLNLLYCAANSTGIDEIKEDCDMGEMLEMCKKAALTSFVDYYFENTGYYDRRFAEIRNAVIAHQIILGKELEGLYSFFEENKIRYIPFKGSAMSDVYPGFATREMGDADIYVDKKHCNVTDAYLKSQGFTCEKDEATNYNNLYVKGLCNVEIHYKFIGGGLNKCWTDFNKTMVADSSAVEGKEQHYELSIEDHYIYLMMHAYKHFAVMGIGIRFLLDIWYYRKKYEDAVNTSHVKEMLSKLELSQYEADCIELSELIFTRGINNCTLNERQESIIEKYLLSVANRGSEDMDGQIFSDRNEIKGRNWIAIYMTALKKLRDNDQWYAFTYPFAYKHKWFRPFALLHTSVKKVIRDPAGVIKAYGKNRG